MTVERRKNSDGSYSYTARLSLPGRGRKCLGTYKQRRDAEAAVERAREDLENGVSLEALGSEEVEVVRFDKFVETEYLNRFSGSTRADYETSSKVLIGVLHSTPLNQITSAEVDLVLARLQQYSPNYRRKLAQRLRQVLNLAVERGYISSTHHPYPRSRKLPTRKPIAVVKTKLNLDSAQWILEHLRQRSQEPGEDGRLAAYWHNLLFFALNTGSRRAEWLGLVASDLNPSNCTVSIDQQWNWSAASPRRELKTEKSKRTIPLAEEVFERIWRYAHEPKNVEPDLVFPRPKKGGGWALWESPSHFSREYTKCLEQVWAVYQAKVKPHDRRLTKENFVVSTHQWRHLYATTLLARSGVDVHRVSRWLGHYSPSFTFEVYSSALEAGAQEAARAAADALSGGQERFV